MSALTAAAAAAGVTLDSDLVEAATPDDAGVTYRHHVWYRGCSGTCSAYAYVRDGRVIKVEGNPDSAMTHGALCPKGLACLQALYNPQRLKYPMKRVGPRGTNQFVRISWDQAMDEISDILMEEYRKYGPECLLISTGGGGNPGFYGPVRFRATFGTPNIVEPGASQCLMPRTSAYSLMNGLINTSITDSGCQELYFDDAPIKTYVLWGAQPSASAPPYAGRCVAALRARGVKTVVVDPRFTADASKADVWVPIRPGTDVAMLLCWHNYIIEHKLYDEEFCKLWTNLPYLIDPDDKGGMLLRANQVWEDGDPNDYVIFDNKTQSVVAFPFSETDTGKFDPELFVDNVELPGLMQGKKTKSAYQAYKERASEFTLEKTSEICWVKPETIEKAIKLYAENKPSGLTLGVATDQHPQSSQAAEGASALEIVLGNICAPGCLIQTWAGEFNVGIDDPYSKNTHFGAPIQWENYDTLTKRLGYREHKAMGEWGFAHMSTVRHAMATGDPYPITCWIERSGNKMAMLANASDWLEAIDNCRLIVHMYMYPTSFSIQAADYLLPAAEWLEMDKGSSCLNVFQMRSAVTHLYEAIDEIHMWPRLAKALADKGHERCKLSFDREYMESMNIFPYTLDEEEWRDGWLADKGITWKEAQEKYDGRFEWISLDQYRHYYDYKKHGETTGAAGYFSYQSGTDVSAGPSGFPTRCGKCEAYCESMIVCGRTGTPWSYGIQLPPADEDYDPLPYFKEPAESPNEPDTEYPLVMSAGRTPWFHHGTLRNSPYLREILPYPQLWINPVDAEKYGIEDGEWVNVESRRATICGVAKVTERERTGCVYMERYWNPELLDSDDPSRSWTTMNVNMLTKNDEPFAPETGSYTLRGFTVKVSKKLDGAPEGVFTKPSDFEVWMPEPSDCTREISTKGVVVS